MHVKRVFLSLFSSTAAKSYWCGGLILAGLLWEFSHSATLYPIADENAYIPEINNFFSGKFVISSYITQWPGYPFMMACILHFLNRHTLWLIRLVTLIIAASSIAVFYQLAKHLFPDSKQIHVRLLQYTFLPIFFPYVGLVYTDAWSVLFCLLALQQALAKRPVLSAILCALDISIRQTNIVWAMFIWLLIIWQDTSLNTWNLRKTCKQSWSFIVVFISFLMLIFITGGVALGDRAMQPVSFNLTNVYFFLFVNFVLFLPLNLQIIISTLKKWHFTRMRLITLSSAFAVYFCTFTDTHPYNVGTFKRMCQSVHNIVLFVLTHYSVAEALAFFPIVGFLYVFLHAGFTQKRFYAFYPCSFFSVVLMPMVEMRYYIIPTALFLLFRREHAEWIEWLVVMLFICLSLLLLHGIYSWEYMP